MDLDPRYAALARLPGSGWRTEELVTPGRAAGYYDVGSGDSQSAQWFDETPETRTSRREYDIWNVLGGRENTPFQSKYFEGVEEADNGNMLIARGLQRPGEDKYNTFDAAWRKDPTTGDYLLVGTADTKEQSSFKKHLPGVVSAIGLPIAAGAAAAGLAGLAGSGAGATAGMTSAEQIALMAANGMTDTQIAAVIGGQAGADLLGQGIASILPTGIDSATRAFLNSNAGYGPGMTGAQTTAFDTALEMGLSLPEAAEMANTAVEIIAPPTTQPLTSTLPSSPGGPPIGPSLPPLGRAPIEPPVKIPPLVPPPSGLPSSVPDSGIPWGRIADIVAKNPMLLTPLITAAGKFFNKNEDTPAQAGPTGPGPQADFTKNAPTPYSRTVTAAPAGYRHGFEPEHKFFTGIGGVGA